MSEQLLYLGGAHREGSLVVPDAAETFSGVGFVVGWGLGRVASTGAGEADPPLGEFVMLLFEGLLVGLVCLLSGVVEGGVESGVGGGVGGGVWHCKRVGVVVWWGGCCGECCFWVRMGGFKCGGERRGMLDVGALQRLGGSEVAYYQADSRRR